MKKQILTFLMLLITFLVVPQVFSPGSKVELPIVDELSVIGQTTKSLVLDETTNEVKYINLESLSGFVTESSSEWFNVSGTRLGGDLSVAIGDYDDLGGETKIIINDASEDIILVTDDFQVQNTSSGFRSSILNANITANRAVQFPDKDGTFAFLDDVPKFIKVSLTSAQLRDIDINPIEVIASPGLGNMIVVQSIVVRYTYNGTPYNALDRIEFDSGGTGIFEIPTNLFNATVSYIRYSPMLDNTIITTEIAENSPLTMECQDDVTIGNGTMDLYITYQIVTL